MAKRSISLIEVLVSLTLLTVLMSTLFFWYRSLAKQKEECRQLRWPLMEERFAHQRLKTLFLKAELPFFSTENSFVFFFDNGANLSPELSGKVLARLYYDSNTQRLCLGVWPKPEANKLRVAPSHSMVLLDGVETCAFHFYQPPDPFKKPVDPKEIGKFRPEVGWQLQWKAAYQMLPALIMIEIKRSPAKGLKERKFRYCFDLPVKIIYAKEKSV